MWRGRKPHAFFGWPIIGRCFLYAGESTNRERRSKDHLLGSSYWNEGPKHWSDLEPRMYRVPTLFARFKLARLAQEWLVCAVTLPLYNERPRIPWNFRRVTKASATHARMMRDSRYAAPYKVSRALIRWSAMAMFALTVFVVNKKVGWW